jgi:hypothetical protein
MVEGVQNVCHQLKRMQPSVDDKLQRFDWSILEEAPATSHTELNREVLLKLGVPAGAIETFGTANKNTREEAVALREWAERNAASAFIIPSEIFPARRVRWIFRREFFGTAVSIEGTPGLHASGLVENGARTGRISKRSFEIHILSLEILDPPWHRRQSGGQR